MYSCPHQLCRPLEEGSPSTEPCRGMGGGRGCQPHFGFSHPPFALLWPFHHHHVTSHPSQLFGDTSAWPWKRCHGGKGIRSMTPSSHLVHLMLLAHLPHPKSLPWATSYPHRALPSLPSTPGTSILPHRAAPRCPPHAP